jgi:hypothetical protein
MSSDVKSAIAPAETAPQASSCNHNEVNQTSQGPQQPSVGKRFVKVAGPPELFRSEKDGNSYMKVLFSVEAGSESSVEEILEQNRAMSWPMRSVPVPTALEPYGTTGEFFSLIRMKIAEQTFLSSRATAMLTYWVLSTWFSECLSLAPCLVITGSPREGDLVLKALRPFCRHPFLMTGVTSATLKTIDWDLRPTLLISEANLTKRVGALLDCSTTMGYMIGRANEYQDYFGPKAIYVGDDLHSAPRFSVHINASATSDTGGPYPRRLTDAVIRSFQNRLVQYRLNNMVRVHNSDFDATTLSSDTRDIANVLGACIVDAPALQTELVSLLAPRAQLISGDRAGSLEALAVEAALSLCHQAKTQVLVREIADEANRIYGIRGEKLQVSAEKLGHKLKKVGLYTRRLGASGNGLLFDRPTQILVHDLAAAYLGHREDVQDTHCSLCHESRGVT